MIDEADRDGDGLYNEEEFFRVLKRRNGKTSASTVNRNNSQQNLADENGFYVSRQLLVRFSLPASFATPPGT
ncbi:Ca2-binding protein (centrin/caltractin), EF-Hand superfamily protein [Plasmopara halstedii]|uniref:Ca2-binding protein (Centrin/caltractin), EF-Hand superfamily protein n=1 Tax=Plasmopara halstedii TaxID=4781 RepID=A0A0P1B515_PLAHL|nr:Ca2-binding protein (centrin/caltractin), EF-Hand superfamily protein [Plasmopara halstedii]CEG49055.1 Ca2-binding protein (centrin/caltractin), EF-Hand superfamily protein [Plasmopara halstedii]|eukprot:XP_024585424.1 Ca2-binding protein (centrin/caltractin), EF-Hand superfamily protein [Plasmopara halstedii]